MHVRAYALPRASGQYGDLHVGRLRVAVEYLIAHAARSENAPLSPDYASGYSADTLACWVILSAWILYERRIHGVRNGLWFILLGVIPGVAVGFAGYLLLRARQGQRAAWIAST